MSAIVNYFAELPEEAFDEFVAELAAKIRSKAKAAEQGKLAEPVLYYQI